MILPAIYGPAFFNSDLALFKNFTLSDSKKLQVPLCEQPEPWNDH